MENQVDGALKGRRIRPFGVLGPVVCVGPVGMGAYGLSWVVAIGAFATFELMPADRPLRWAVVLAGLAIAGCLQVATLLLGKRPPRKSESTDS